MLSNHNTLFLLAICRMPLIAQILQNTAFAGACVQLRYACAVYAHVIHGNTNCMHDKRTGV